MTTTSELIDIPLEPSDVRAEQPGWATAVLHQRRGVTAIAYLVLLVLAGVFAGWLAPYPPNEQDLSAVLQGPSPEHLLGTDTLGRDVLSRILHGIVPSLEYSLIALGVFLAIGVPLGILAGYLGGRLDNIVSRSVELLMAIPPIIIVLVALGVFSSSPTAAMITLGVLAAMGLIRVVRGATLVVRDELYVTAARVAGVKPARIMSTHVLRRVLGPILVQATLFAGITLAVQSALAFLGLIGSSDQPTWGGMIAEASQVITYHAWLLFPPGIALALTVLAFGLLGDTIRDVTSGEQALAPPPARRTRPGAVTREETTSAAIGAEGALLSVRGLAVSANVSLVDDASFEVLPGQTVAIVGESGCGKSLTALAVLGLLPDGVVATAGRVVFDGVDLLAGGPNAYRAVRGSGIGYVAQDALGSLDPTHTVGSHLQEVIGCHEQLTKRAARVRAVELLTQVKIPEPERILGAYPHELSGGMAQRVNIAIALAGRPQLLIADEPTTALDVTVQAEILRLLHDLRDSTQMAILLITHDWGVVADIADQVVVMYAGEVVEQADIASMFRAPRFPYSAALLAADPSRAHPGGVLPTVPGRVPPPGSWPAGCRFATRCQHTRDVCTTGPIELIAVAERSVTRCVRVDELVTEGALPR